MKGRFSIILFLFLFSGLYAQKDFRIISSSAAAVVVEYTPAYLDTSVITQSNQEFIKLSISNGIHPSDADYGYPDIPHRELNFGVPSEVGNVVRVIDVQYSTINAAIAPIPQMINQAGIDVMKYIVNDEFYKEANNEIVRFGEFGFVRELPVQTIEIFPIQYDVSGQAIKCYSRIVFQIDFAPPTKKTQLISDDFLKNIIVNFNVAKQWGAAKHTLKKLSRSVLADGTWYRFKAPVEGIYKIDRTALASLGIDAASVDPQTIKIYNNGGYPLPEEVNAARPDGLTEIAIEVVGEEDGSFDQNDYILFYGRGTDFYEYSSTDKDIVRYKNPFSRDNYFWITSGGTTGKRVQNKTSLNSATSAPQTYTRAFNFIEDDLINIGKTGRDYWGDEFSTTTSSSKTYMTTLNDRIPEEPINYNFRFANASSLSIPIRIYESDNQIYSSTLFGFGSNKYIYGYQHVGTATYSGNLSENRSTLKISCTLSSSEQRAYLDYIDIEYKKGLVAANDSLIFYSLDSTNVFEYNLSNFTSSQISVYDITDYSNIKKVSDAYISGGQFVFKSEENKEDISKYLAITASKFRSISEPELIQNADIRNYQPGTEFIIISHKDFQDYAEQLKNYRSSQSPYPLTTSVFYIEDIYNEFSGGSMDPTAIRDFLKYCYENWTVKPMYVLLFGCGTYDYFNVEEQNNNFIPTYQTEESLNELKSYPTDDYYFRVSGNDKKVDFAMGRIPVRTAEDAQTIIEKIRVYENESEKSLWRNTITLVADDGWVPSGDNGALHTRQSENLANFVIPSYFIQNKIYLAAYPAVLTGLGRKKPEVNKAIIDGINNGTLILNYIGHGSPTVWADEDVFEKSTSIPMLDNDKYFFLTAATCDFGIFDDPTETSSTQLMLFLPEAGAIGAFTAARVVYSNSNSILNDSLYTNLFRTRDEDNLPIRLGMAIFYTKQFRTTDNDEKYYLFCDPTVRLNEPHKPVSIDSVNHTALTSLVQVNALGDVVIEGSVRNPDGTLNDFNGEGIISVLDSKKSVDLPEINYSMTVQGGVIFKGRASITNGRFTVNFTVPKDISYENQNGKIVSYIFNTDNDGIGYTNNIIVGGTNANAQNDGDGPSIDIYFDDVSYESSYLVNPEFSLMVKLADDTGLNTTGTGVGHKLEGIVNGDENSPIDFSNYFIGDLDAGGKSGLIDYRFSSMDPGDYSIQIKAWDVFNNPSIADAYFTVVDSDGLVIRDVVNYPNPFSYNTTFTFRHNLTSALNVKIKIYTIAGRLIKEIDQNSVLDKFVRIDWDGRDEDGNEIANGTYLYKLIVNSVDGEYSENLLGKLAIIK